MHNKKKQQIPRKFFDALRRSSAKLLRLDIDDLSPSEQVRIDRVASMRLLLDQLQQRQLQGEEIDARQFTVASEALERLLGGQPEAPTHVFASDELRRKLRAMIERTLGDVGDAAAADLADVQRREEVVQVLAAAPVDAAQAAPPPQPQLQQPTNNNVVPIAVKERMRLEEQAAKERVAKESAQNERAFRDYYNNGGVLIAPGVNIDPRR